MKKYLLVAVVTGFLCSSASPVFAVKQFKDVFLKEYAGENANEEFKKLAEEASCNVCHVDKEKKKVRNPYGEAMHSLLEKDKFPVKEFQKDTSNEKLLARLKEIFKKTEGEKSGDEKHKTFGDRMKANLLPGGDVKGK